MALNYRPLVELMVLDSSGEFVDRRSMNKDIMDVFPEVSPPSEAAVNYLLQWMESAARQAKSEPR